MRMKVEEHNKKIEEQSQTIDEQTRIIAENQDKLDLLNKYKDDMDRDMEFKGALVTELQAEMKVKDKHLEQALEKVEYLE